MNINLIKYHFVCDQLSPIPTNTPLLSNWIAKVYYWIKIWFNYFDIGKAFPGSKGNDLIEYGSFIDSNGLDFFFIMEELICYWMLFDAFNLHLFIYENNLSMKSFE